MDVARFASLFPLGSHLCREPAQPLGELKHDMGLLKAHGFNLVKIQEHWACDEPEEGSLPRLGFGHASNIARVLRTAHCLVGKLAVPSTRTRRTATRPGRSR